MDRQDEDEIDRADERARLRRITDFNDLQNENAGLDTGKRLRFTSLADTPQARGDSDRRRWLYLAATLTLEQRQQQIADYLADLDRASLRALQAAEHRATEAQERLLETQRRASVTAGGRRFYVTADGRHAYFEDRTELTAEQLAMARIESSDAKWETFEQWSETTKATSHELSVIRAHRERILDARDRVAKGEALSAEDIDRLEVDLADLDDTMPESVRDALEDSGPSRLSSARDHLRGQDSSVIAATFNDLTGTTGTPQPPSQERASPPKPVAPEILP